MIQEVLLVHHSHTDVGYTHPQPTVFELHSRFIDSALDLADDTRDFRDDCRFRWTCEVTGITRRWWNEASNESRSRFLDAVARGQFEVAAMEWHLTPLADMRMLARSLESVNFFHALGVPVRSAMNTDVNGVPWGLVELLLDHGVTGFSMAINSHFGAAPTPRPGAFRWESPSGRELVVWNGFQYWHAANVKMGLPQSGEVMDGFLAQTERRGYSLDFLPVQITNPHHPDNAGPDPALSAFVRDWNDRNPRVRLRTVLLSEVFDRLRTLDLPVMSGDWTDYWNFGAGSSARETTVLLEGQRVLDVAHSAGIWSGQPATREPMHLDAAHERLTLYAEHTWGADCSISQPESIETRAQWAMKAATVYEGMAHARIVKRDALHRLAESAGGEEPTALLYNPLPFDVSVPVAVPASGFEWYVTPGVQHRHRLEGLLSSLPSPQPGESASKWVRADLPGLGYRAMPLTDWPNLSSEGLLAEPDQIRSDLMTLEFDPVNGGVRSLRVRGREFAGIPGEFTFGAPVLERPAGGSRREIMTLDFNLFEPADGWHSDWQAERSAGRLLSAHSEAPNGAVEHHQTFEMANGDRVAITYRLFAGVSSVDVEAILDSAGDSRPYSLVLPFTLREDDDTMWHYDTPGAIVEFDREQLPNTCRHFVTARGFVRMQNNSGALSVSTPDCPLWKFGGMFFDQSINLRAQDRRPIMLAWLANNYWEVNFLANQSGQTRYRFQIAPTGPEPVSASFVRGLPFSRPPHMHLYRDVGPSRKTADAMLEWHGDGVALEFVTRRRDKTFIALSNLLDVPNHVTLSPKALSWSAVFSANLAGEPIESIALAADRSCRIELPPRGLAGVLLD